MGESATHPIEESRKIGEINRHWYEMTAKHIAKRLVGLI